MEVRELLSSYDFPGDDIPLIMGSALTAMECASEDPENDEYKPIAELMSSVDDYIPNPERDLDKPFLMSVEDVFSISGRGTVATGRIERGLVKVGEEIEICGIRETQKTTVTGIEMFRKLLDEGRAGDNVGLLLRGLKREQVERGQVICKPARLHLTQTVQDFLDIIYGQPGAPWLEHRLQKQNNKRKRGEGANQVFVGAD